MSGPQNQEGREQGGLKGVFNKAADAVGGMVGKASASTTGARDSQAFVTNACVSDLYEIEAGRLAAQRGGSDAVRAFGEMMVAHHATAKHQMQAALMSSEVTTLIPDLKPATQLDDRREGLLRRLREAPAEDFDKTYLDQQRTVHQEAIGLHRGYAENGDNAQLRSVALGGLPMIERHLKAIERIGVH